MLTFLQRFPLVKVRLTDKVSTAVRMSDGAIVVVDVIEGVSAQVSLLSNLFTYWSFSIGLFA
jgi:translation elongation factor EF-G